jgi:hypothetical protein
MGQNEKENKNVEMPILEIAEVYERRIPRTNTQSPNEKPIDLEYMTGIKKGGDKK